MIHTVVQQLKPIVAVIIVLLLLRSIGNYLYLRQRKGADAAQGVARQVASSMPVYFIFLSLYFGIDWIWIAFLLCALVFLVQSCWIWPRQRGRKLIDLAKLIDKRVSILSSALIVMAFLLFPFINQWLFKFSDFESIMAAIVGITIGVGIFLMSLRSSEWYEHGVYRNGIFFPWSQVASYYWDPQHSPKLTLQLQPVPFFMTSGSLRCHVPARHRDQAQQILDAKLPMGDRTPGAAEPNDAIEPS